MNYLIAIISSGKGTWSEVSNLMNKGTWKKVFIITNDFTDEKFTVNKSNVEKVRINDRDFENSVKKLSKLFKESIQDMEVALNITSGTGKEHMIVINSILEAGLSFKFAVIEDNKVKILDLISNEMVYDYENLL